MIKCEQCGILNKNITTHQQHTCMTPKEIKELDQDIKDERNREYIQDYSNEGDEQQNE